MRPQQERKKSAGGERADAVHEPDARWQPAAPAAAEWLQRCRAALLAWFDASARVLPWREDRDPYRIWISEIMLQQTQVRQVLPYYERFLARFPDIPSLAAAPLDAVLKAWEGMGYYARARNLHRAAGEIMARYGGRFPQERDVVLGLPGVGVYTAAAILSIAFGRPEVVVDGNVVRVIARLTAMAEEARGAGRRRIEGMAAAFFDPGRPGDFNEAMMELGAVICTPRAPVCALCPVAACCAALKEGAPERYPVKSPRRAKPHHQIAAALIWQEGRLLIARRPEKGLLGGLWEFPGGKQESGESLEQAAVRCWGWRSRSSTGLSASITPTPISASPCIFSTAATLGANRPARPAATGAGSHRSSCRSMPFHAPTSAPSRRFSRKKSPYRRFELMHG